MRKYWWKVVAILMLLYVIVGGLMFRVPRLNILNETIRALHFHVPMWFGMIILLFISAFYSVRYLSKSEQHLDDKAIAFANIGVVFGFLGLFTGMFWAKFTWNEWWSGDPKQNTSAIALLIYLAYLVLRHSFTDEQQRARVGAIYNIFAFAALIPLLFVLPRMTHSLHPGNGGNPGFNAYDLDSNLRKVFYPAVIAWTLMGVWMATLRIRLKRVEQEVIEKYAVS